MIDDLDRTLEALLRRELPAGLVEQVSVTFATPTEFYTAATFSATGIYTLRLTANDGQFSNSDDVQIQVQAAPSTHLAPVVDAGPDQRIAADLILTLAGQVSDDGLPAGAQISRQWSRVSGPAAVTFSSATSSSTTATFPVSGGPSRQR